MGINSTGSEYNGMNDLREEKKNMLFKTKELPPCRDIPLLEEIQKEKILFDFRRKRSFRRLYRLYMATALTAVLLLLFVLAVRGDGFSYTWRAIRGWFDQNTEEPAPSDDTTLNTDQGQLGGDIPTNGQPADKPTDPPASDGTNTEVKPPLTWENLYYFDSSAVPEGETAIIPKDLSLSSYGVHYINNATGLNPDIPSLLQREFQKQDSLEYLSTAQVPLVLIVHTHGTEAYSPDGAISYFDDGGELARSDDPTRSVVAVGKTFADVLTAKGIGTIHCTVMHDKNQYKDSYARAEDTIRRYLEQYPSIRLVIDLHRDAVIQSTGELIRPVTLSDGEAAAQVMCVVGSSWGGEANPKWEGNLALALQLRESLNKSTPGLCRPVYLRSSTYNQEIAPYSLLLEMGACGNSLEEATRSAVKVAEALAKFIPNL